MDKELIADILAVIAAMIGTKVSTDIFV